MSVDRRCHGDGVALLLRTYANVMPSDADRGRAVTDAALGRSRDRAEAVGSVSRGLWGVAGGPRVAPAMAKSPTL